MESKNQENNRNEKSNVEIRPLTPAVEEIDSNEASKVKGGLGSELNDPKALRGSIIWQS
jgi:hypothetical protein